MQISISNVIQVARLIGQGTIIPIVKACLKMWLDFTKADVIGEELVINGDFSDGITGWSVAYPNTTLSINDDELRATANSNGAYGVSQELSLNNGSTYQVVATINVDSASGGTANLRVANNSNLSVGAITLYQSTGTITTTFVATSSTMYIGIADTANDSNNYVEIDNITVKEVSQFVKDKSTNSNDAKLFTGKALSFGGNDYVDCGVVDTINSDVVSVAFWSKVDSGANMLNSNILGSMTSGGAWGTLLVRFSNNTTFKVLWNNAYSKSVTIPDVRDGAWHRYVVVRSGSGSNLSLDIYIDGVSVSTTSSITTVVGTYTSNFSIGRGGDYNGGYLRGEVSDVEVYDAKLEFDDVVFDYNNPNLLVTDNPDTTLTLSNLSAYYALSEGSGSIAYDSTGLGAELVTNGDFEGTDWWSIGTYWAVIGNGLATRTVVGSQTNYSLSKSGVFVIGTSYTIRVVINAITSGNVKVRIGATDSPEYISEGTYVFTGVCSSNDVLRISPSDDFNGSISNISVKEVKADDGDILGATWVDQQPTIPQLGMQDWSKGSNLYLFSEPIANEGAASGATYESFTWGNTSGANFTNCTRFGDNSVDRYRYGATVPSSVDATLSFYIIMDDLSEPNIGINSVSGDFSMVIGGTVGTTLSTTSTNVGGNVWRVSKTADTTTTNLPNNGIVKYTTQSAKGFRVVGWQIEESLIPNSYIGTNGSAASNATLVQNPNNVGFDVLGNRLRLREGGFNLDGSGYGEVDMSSDLTAITNGSIQFWMKNTKTTSFVLFNETSTTNYLGAWNGSGDFYNDSASGTVTQYADDNSTVTSTKITDGDWHFYTFTGIDLSLFDKFQISNYSNSSSIWLDCIIDDVIIYCDVLTPEEISFNYNYFLPFKRANVAFKARVLADGGTFEAESCLIETIDNLA